METTLISTILIAILVKEKAGKNSEDNVLEHAEKGSIISVLRRRPTLIYFALIIMGLNFVYSQWNFLLQINVNTVYGAELGARYYGRMAGLNGLVVVTFSGMLTYLLMRIRPYKVIIYGGITYAAGFALLGFYRNLFPWVTSPVIFFFSCIFIITFGEILLTISINPYIYNHTPSSHRGRMSGTISLITGFARIFSPTISSLVVVQIGFFWTWRAYSLLAVICCVLMYILGRYDKPLKPEIKVS